MREKQAAFTLNAQAADCTVDVTVNARGQLVKTVIDIHAGRGDDRDESRADASEADDAACSATGGHVGECLLDVVDTDAPSHQRLEIEQPALGELG
jgi:hypothetical protein